MADQQYEFEDDEDAAKRPAVPAPKPPTGQVAKGDAAAPPIKEAGKVDYAFEESAEEPAPKKKSHAPAAGGGDGREPTPNTAQPVAGGKGKGRPPAPPVDEEVDPDVKPGSRKDLWNCPHCGAGNKPGRPTCRTCGKNPDDPVETPWFKRPPVIGGAVGGLVLLILIVVFSGGTDLSAKPADEDSIDKKARIGGSASGTHEVGGRVFTAKKRFSVVGRCIGAQASTTVDGSVTVVLLLSTASVTADVTATFNGDITEAPGAPAKFIIVHLLSGRSEYAKNQILSISGELCVSDGSSWGSGEYIVWPESVQTGS